MKIKTSELTGPALDSAVAKCDGVQWWAAEEARDGLFLDYERTLRYSPSTDWSQGGPIIEQEGIALYLYGNSEWNAHIGGKESIGPTPLIAAMRCHVAFHLGDIVEIPEELQPATLEP